ncbi:AMP-binding protein [Nocardia sp. alder85J]|uniref:AMP-binding protein n=1 Tax=Nocardia sp. alder85J TaxID=2862949 RepID=UPI001CD5BB0A|nr:AMP-binding protein [Nocardia sp. alder85J]MCX4098513.1 AMP-binding protein [Nocardia sp. alder85J]
MRTLEEMLRVRVAAAPDQAPLEFPSAGGAVAAPSYAELYSRVESIAALLLRRVEPGERVLLAYPAGPEFVAAFFGCLTAGVVAVPVPPPLPGPMRDRFGHIVADCDPALILTAGAWSALFDAGVTPWAASDVEAVAPAGAGALPAVAPGDLAYLQYSSGTTGSPRGVRVTHANALANLAMLASMFAPGPEETTVGWMPHFHDFGLVVQLLAPIFDGRRNVVMDPLDFVRFPKQWLHRISGYRAQFAPLPAFACRMLLQRVPVAQRAEFDLSSLRAIGVGADTVSHDELRAFADGLADTGLNPTALLPCYGMAEAVALVASCPPGTPWTTTRVSRDLLSTGVLVPGSGDLALIGSGVPAPGIRVRIVDPVTRADRPDGHTGEILLAGDNISAGYWGRPDPAVVLDGVRYLPTGDLGAMNAGELFVLDRLADLITIAGRHHYPFDLERTAAAAAGVPVRRAVAFGVADAVALVLEVDGAQVPDPEAVTAAVATAVASSHGVPVRDVTLTATGTIPVTTSGKARRGVCRERYSSARTTAVAP